MLFRQIETNIKNKNNFKNSFNNTTLVKNVNGTFF